MDVSLARISKQLTVYARKRRLRPSRRAFVEIELAGIIRRMRLWLARCGRIKWAWFALIFDPQPQICKVAGRPRKNEAHGDFVGIVGAVEAASLATGGSRGVATCYVSIC